MDDSAGTPRDIRTDIGNFDFSTPRGVWDVTGIDKSAMERQLLLADYQVNINGFFDPGANLAHAVFKTVSSTSVARTVTNTISSQTIAAECMFSDYALTRAADGAFTYVAPGVLADGTVPTWS